MRKRRKEKNKSTYRVKKTNVTYITKVHFTLESNGPGRDQRPGPKLMMSFLYSQLLVWCSTVEGNV